MLLVPSESRVLNLTVSIAQHLSRTGSLLRICGEVGEFERVMGRRLGGRLTGRLEGRFFQASMEFLNAPSGRGVSSIFVSGRL
jgi:hypothetical protein